MDIVIGMTGCGKNQQVINCQIIGTTVNSNYVGGYAGYLDNAQSVCVAVQNCSVSSKGSCVGGIAGYLASGGQSYNFVQNTTVEGYSKVGGFAGEMKAGKIHHFYINADVTATSHSAGGIVGYLNNNGMTNAVNVSRIRVGYVAGSTIQAPEKAGGIIGDSYEELLGKGYYYSIFVEAYVTSDNIETASLGIGGRKEENYKLVSSTYSTYVYEGSSINGQKISEDNDTFDLKYYATLTDLKKSSFYQKMEMWTWDFNHAMIKQNKYPTLLNSSVSGQTGIDLPQETTYALSLASEDLPQITAYSLRANRLNVDLSNASEGTTLTYESENTESNTIEVEDRTYTFEYNYQSPITFKLANAKEEETIVITPEEVQNTVSMENSVIAYLDDEKLIVSGEEIEGNYTNLVEGRALSINGDIYNIAQNTWENTETAELALIETEAKETYDYKGNQIETFGTYSEVNGEDVDAIFTVKNQTLSVTDGKLEKVQADKIVDNYNGKEYETILSEDGKLYDLKEPIKYPENFENENIKTIVVNNENDKHEVMVYYQNGNIQVFNYMTGEILYEKIEKEDISLWEYIQEQLNLNESNETIQDSYQTSQKIEEKLQEKPIDEETEKNANYITMYNSQTQTHEIYKEEEIFNLSNEDTKSETEKIEEKEELKEYYLSEDGDKTRKNKGFYLVISSIAGVCIALVVFRLLVVKKKKHISKKR